MRFRTPTLLISLATRNLTVRTSIPNGRLMSLFDLPSNSICRTSCSRGVKAYERRREDVPIDPRNVQQTLTARDGEPTPSLDSLHEHYDVNVIEAFNVGNRGMDEFEVVL
jgi:hypothetical protein